jgi:hypothetical protein
MYDCEDWINETIRLAVSSDKKITISDQDYEVIMYDYWDRERSARKAERYRQEFYNRRKRMYGHLSKEEALKDALMTAARHAAVVVAKSSLVQPHTIRVGEFVTSLRREIKETVVYGCRDLTDKDLWEDILILKAGANVGKETKRIIKAARYAVENKGVVEDFEDRLKAVNNEVDHAITILKDLEDICVEEDEIMSDFRELAKNM